MEEANKENLEVPTMRMTRLAKSRMMQSLAGIVSVEDKATEGKTRRKTPNSNKVAVKKAPREEKTSSSRRRSRSAKCGKAASPVSIRITRSRSAALASLQKEQTPRTPPSKKETRSRRGKKTEDLKLKDATDKSVDIDEKIDDEAFEACKTPNFCPKVVSSALRSILMEEKIISSLKSIRKRCFSTNDLESTKKMNCVSFHSPANTAITVDEIDDEMQPHIEEIRLERDAFVALKAKNKLARRHTRSMFNVETELVRKRARNLLSGQDKTSAVAKDKDQSASHKRASAIPVLVKVIRRGSLKSAEGETKAAHVGTSQTPNKVEERQQEWRSMNNEATTGQKSVILKGVRSNRRFDLMMKFREQKN